MRLFFAEWTENVLQKSHSVNMCIIIHSSGRIVCLLWPHFQRAQKQAGGVGSPEQRPFFPTRLGLRNAHHSAGTEPFTGLLAAHEWQLNHTELFPSTGAGWLHCKKYFFQNLNIWIVYKSVRKRGIKVWVIHIAFTVCQQGGTQCKKHKAVLLTGCQGPSWHEESQVDSEK